MAGSTAAKSALVLSCTVIGQRFDLLAESCGSHAEYLSGLSGYLDRESFQIQTGSSWLSGDHSLQRGACSNLLHGALVLQIAPSQEQANKGFALRFELQ